jgi:hypothetical protein
VISGLDLVLRRVLRAGVPGMADTRIGFQPPNDKWRQAVGLINGVWLNCYLIEIVEDRKLRSNEAAHEMNAGIVQETPPPARLRCTYLISAWSSKPDSQALAATQLEHDALAYAARALMAASPLHPSHVLSPVETLTLPLSMRDVDLPTAVAPPSSFGKHAEFWGTMGRPQAWKPVVELCVTIPVAFDPYEIAGLVETIFLDAGHAAATGITALDPDGPVERLIDIGGTVLDARPPNAGSPVPVPMASVALETPAGVRLAVDTTDDGGHFRIGGVRPGAYLLRWWAAGMPSPPLSPTPVDVPNAGGDYQLAFTP